MYNYNEEGGVGIFIRDLVVKLIFVIILVLLLIWLFPKQNMKPFYDRVYTENITLMKETARSYYTNERLPVKVNDKVTMTLKEMIDKHLILDLKDADGKTCNVNTSYVEVTKLETEYAMKVSLDCGDKHEFVVEYIGCTDVCEDCDDVKEEPLTNTVTKVVTKPKTIIKTVTKVIEKPIIIEKPCPDPEEETWLLYHKTPYSGTGSWTTNQQPTGCFSNNNVTTCITQVDAKTDAYSETYTRKYKTIYSSSYVYQWQQYPANYTYPGTRLLNLDSIGMSKEAQNMTASQINLKVTNGEYFTYYDYQKYIDTRRIYFVQAPNSSYDSFDFNATKMRNSSLTSKNFSITDIDVFWNYAHNTYEVRTTARLYNHDGVTYNYDDRLNEYVIYVPHKFTVSWNEPSTNVITQFKYMTTVTYKDQWALKGSDLAKSLEDSGYNIISIKTVEK